MSAATEDLFLEARPRATRAACRSVADDMITRALEAIFTGLPQQILKLTKLCEASLRDEGSPFHERWDCRWPKDTDQANANGDDMQGLASAKCPVDVYRAPTHVLDLWDRILPMISDIVDMFDLIQLYLLFKTPAAEEGNNTGVEIQQQCIKVLLDARRYVLGCQGYPKLYFMQRGKLASKCIKYPDLEDYKRALMARDEEECRDCRYLLSRLRAQILAVLDVLHKNYGRVSEPKGVAGSGVAPGMY